MNHHVPPEKPSIEAELKPILANRGAIPEQGACGIRKRLLEGGNQRQFAVSQVIIQDACSHFHRNTWELYIVQEGQGIIELDGLSLEIKEGDIIEIPPGVTHKAIPMPSLTVLVVMSPHNAEQHDIHYI